MGLEIHDVKNPPHPPLQGNRVSDEKGDCNLTGTNDEESNQIKEDGDAVFQIKVALPHDPYETQVMVSMQDQVQDLRQSIVELPGTAQYSCFHLELNGERINDFIELSEIKGLTQDTTLRLFEDPYTEKDARMHLIRVREIIGAAGDRYDMAHGISAGLSLHDLIVPGGDNGAPGVVTSSGNKNPLADYDFNAPPSISKLLPSASALLPKTVKFIGASMWNPPPFHLRQKGHLLYVQVTTNEGDQFQITSHVSGFFVNKCSNSKFDPFPRPAPKHAAAHSLLTLIGMISPSFNNAFTSLLELNSRRDPLIHFQFSSALASSPWLVNPQKLSLSAHQPDLTRSQETYLLSGIGNTENLRDWNEEIQSTKELPRNSVRERVFRERLMAKTVAEFTEAALRGAVVIARGEVPPLNPTESKDAQIFVFNNIFYSFGADGMGTFTTEGGDEAARVAIEKDVIGVKIVNQLDIPDLATPGTILVDYLGKRLVAQSIVPGIFKHREPEDHQVDYGGVEGRDVIAENEAFVPVFSKLSKLLRVKRHPVWDKEGKKHVLEGSVETKGLLGTDGRKYILDLYRLTPLDIRWLEEYWCDMVSAEKPKERNYPHRMASLRPELVEAFWRSKMTDHVKQEIIKQKSILETKAQKSIDQGTPDEAEIKGKDTIVKNADETELGAKPERLNFSLDFNPDVFCGQAPQTSEEKEEWADDEKRVRQVCDFLHEIAIPGMMQDLKDGEVGFPMDGRSLGQLMHKRGINIRYLGKLATLAEEQGLRLRALKALSIQEMIARGFKHLANRHLKDLPIPFGPACLAHLLNCLLGSGLNTAPSAQLDEELQFLYQDADFSFAKVTVETMKAEIENQVQLRYRYQLEEGWMPNIWHIQLLREISLKLGLQMVAKDYRFSSDVDTVKEEAAPVTNGATAHQAVNGHTNGAHGKKKRKNRDTSPASVSGSHNGNSIETFTPDDIANIVPIIKDSSAKSIVADEALEAGRISILQNNKELGQDLLVESLSLHEQIYGVLHPEVARVYHQLAMFYYQLEEKAAAVELAHKAVIISERTLGIDSNETILSYLNLALFLHGYGNTESALSCMRHALELWKIIYGLKHPDSITTINNAAVMLQSLKLYHESRQWFEASLHVCEEVSGEKSVNTATLCFQLAQALALDHDPNAAVQRMRDSYSIFLSKLGADDRNTKEAESWLEQLTHNAVSIAKHAKDLKVRRLRGALLTPRVTLATRPQPQTGQSPTELTNGRREQNGSIALDSRSIDELMKYIEEGDKTPKKSSTPPKKRTGQRRQN